ncbi:MAG: sigma-70 family RNA polymerase sigma factor [Cryobacterium sp.]|nr:sigma-70 family RNA polymerase sigma factor [Micrococcales bacterium]MBX3078255.1 sigma-70 family RNA polymerase sigma factor [Cryobacterium sp.]HNP15846.1 sigma-70 family RNA polymerase sigma factor [Terrimesophilobacter sp.]
MHDESPYRAPSEEDRAAHAELLRVVHDEHAPALWRYTVWLCGDRQLAEDIVQETLLRAWRRPNVLDQSESSARAWLFTVARNLVTDHHRSAKSRNEIGTDSPPERWTDDGVDAMLDTWLVADAIAGLSADHQVVVVQAYYHGQSVAQLAAALDIPEGTVKSRLHYALRALRLALQERGVTG